MESVKDYYKALGVSKTASSRDIQMAYTAKLADLEDCKLEGTPFEHDVNQRLEDLYQAFKVLAHKSGREKYDRQRQCTKAAEKEAEEMACKLLRPKLVEGKFIHKPRPEPNIFRDTPEELFRHMVDQAVYSTDSRDRWRLRARFPRSVATHNLQSDQPNTQGVKDEAPVLKEDVEGQGDQAQGDSLYDAKVTEPAAEARNEEN